MLYVTSCNSVEVKPNEFVSKNDFYLDTIVDIKIYDSSISTQEAENIIDKAFSRIEELEDLLSLHIEGSDLYKIKENAGLDHVKVSEETIHVIKSSLEYSQLSNGHFDITTGILVGLWVIDPPNGYIPTNSELDDALPKIDYKKIQIDEENSTVKLEDEGMIADLGAIAKGYIADEVKEVLVDNGVKHAIIYLGGNILLVGNKENNVDFKIGIQEPSANRGAYLGLISGNDISVVSSGDYERYFEVDGKRYHHILDPQTGYPADNELRQVTIISKESMDGDGLSTSAFLLGLEDGIDLIESLIDTEAIFVTKDYKIYITSGIGDVFEFDEQNYGDDYEVIRP
nr:FAD:protein FMN transferase [Alkalibaculum sporogenes]